MDKLTKCIFKGSNILKWAIKREEENDKAGEGIGQKVLVLNEVFGEDKDIYGILKRGAVTGDYKFASPQKMEDCVINKYSWIF